MRMCASCAHACMCKSPCGIQMTLSDALTLSLTLLSYSLSLNLKLEAANTVAPLFLPPSVGRTGTWNHLFTWVHGIWTEVFMFVQQVLLTSRPTTQSSIYPLQLLLLILIFLQGQVICQVGEGKLLTATCTRDCFCGSQPSFPSSCCVSLPSLVSKALELLASESHTEFLSQRANQPWLSTFMFTGRSTLQRVAS